MDFRSPDTAIRALATKDTRKRPGHDRPPGFTGGNPQIPGTAGCPFEDTDRPRNVDRVNSRFPRQLFKP